MGGTYGGEQQMSIVSDLAHASVTAICSADFHVSSRRLKSPQRFA
jgi:hypothetical protein